jgi:hypothetical protein
MTDNLYVFHQGSGNNGQLWYSYFDGTNWDHDTQIQNIGMTDSPSAVVYNGQLYVFHQGSNNNGQLWYTFSSDGTNWSRDALVPNVGITGAPSAVVDGSYLIVFHQGYANNGQLWHSTFDGTNWGQDTQIPNVGMSGSPWPVFYNGNLYVFHQGYGNNGQLWYTVAPGGIVGGNWGADTQVPNVGMTASPSAVVDGSDLIVFHQGSNNNGQLWYSPFNGTNWGKDTQIPNVGMTGSSLAVFYNGNLYVFHQGLGNNGQLWYTVSPGGALGRPWGGDTLVQNVGMSIAPGSAEFAFTSPPPPQVEVHGIEMNAAEVFDDIVLGAEEPRTRRSLGRGDRPFALPDGARPGRLVVVGSGIKSISQFTLEAVAHIEHADVVFYAVADPATERFIETKNPNSVDLYPLYDDDKPRHKTYTQMTEVMLRKVRQGHNVVGVFYGHPGVFVNPSHRAIAIARDEGFEAFMLPGISTEDLLYADLGIDPSRPGCQTVEATDLLLRERPLLTESHVIIFQIGCVGDMGFKFKGFGNQHFPVLVDRLAAEYGEQHTLTHYIAAQYPGVEPIIERLTIAQLRQPEIAKRITGISTFYLPPKSMRPDNAAVASKLGFGVLDNAHNERDNVRNERDFVAFPAGVPYGERELKAVAELESHAIPRNYRRTRTSQAMYDTLYDLATKPEELYAFKRVPRVFADGKSGLSPAERRALASRHGGHIWAAMKRNARDIAVEFVEQVIRDPALASRYAEVCRQRRDQHDGATTVSGWLKLRGFEITPDNVSEALADVVANSLGFFAATYHTVWDNQPGPVIVISKDAVTVDGVRIRRSVYANSVLKWSAADGNQSSAELVLAVETDDRWRASLNGAKGAKLSGTYWIAGQTQPGSRNLIGMGGAYTAEGIGNGGDPLTAWEGAYQTYVRQSASTFRLSDGLTLGLRDGTISIAHRGGEVKRLRYAKNVVSWSVDDGNTGNGSIYFFRPGAPSEPATNRFIGKIWEADQTPPVQSNWLGCAGSLRDPAAAARDAELEYTAIVTGMNLAIGVAALRLWKDGARPGRSPFAGP